MLVYLQAQVPPPQLNVEEGVFAGSKNAPRMRASMKRRASLATYDSANEAEQLTATNKAKGTAPCPGQQAFAAQPFHTDPAGEQEQHGARLEKGIACPWTNSHHSHVFIETLRYFTIKINKSTGAELSCGTAAAGWWHALPMLCAQIVAWSL